MSHRFVSIVTTLIIFLVTIGCSNKGTKGGPFSPLQPQAQGVVVASASYLTIGELSIDATDQSLVYVLRNRSATPVPANAATDIVVSVNGQEISRTPFSQLAQQQPQLLQPNANVTIDSNIKMINRKMVSVRRDDTRGFADANEYQKIRARTLDFKKKLAPEIAITGLYRDNLGHLVIELTNNSLRRWNGGDVEIAMAINGVPTPSGANMAVKAPAIAAFATYNLKIPLIVAMPVPPNGPPPIPPVHSRFLSATVGKTYKVSLTIPNDADSSTNNFAAPMTNHFEATKPLRIPGSPPPPQDGYATLLANPLIADNLVWTDFNNTQRKFAQWSSLEKQQLQTMIDRTERRNFTGMSSRPNLTSMANPLVPTFAKSQAWNLYLARVAQSLWLERNKLVKWSLLTYTPEQVKFLLNSSTMFQVSGTNYLQLSERGFSLEWRPRIGYDFLAIHNMIKSQPQETIYALTDWLRGYSWHVSEMLSIFDPTVSRQTLLKNFSVEAGPTVESVLYSKPGGPNWAAGCWGTGGLYMALLASVNIPVLHDRPDAMRDHLRPYFPTVDLHLAHGDDVYEEQFTPHAPGFPSSGLFWSLAKTEQVVPSCNSSATCSAAAPQRNAQWWRVSSLRAIMENLSPADTSIYARNPTSSYNPPSPFGSLGLTGTEPTTAAQRLDRNARAIGANSSHPHAEAVRILSESYRRFSDTRHALP